VVPASALVPAASARSAVFVAEADRARLRPVTIGARDPKSGTVELTGGIGPGERVVVGPAPFPSALRDDQRLRVTRTEPR
jgi:multidrug efflux pump subunit AcrA (membrane-fusion protein)